MHRWIVNLQDLIYGNQLVFETNFIILEGVPVLIDFCFFAVLFLLLG